MRRNEANSDWSDLSKEVRQQKRLHPENNTEIPRGTVKLLNLLAKIVVNRRAANPPTGVRTELEKTEPIVATTEIVYNNYFVQQIYSQRTTRRPNSSWPEF